MNWNNGQLARHSRRSYNNDATKQKQYFAQAKRQKATESRKQKYTAADFVPSYLKDLPEKVDRPSHDAARHKEPRRKIFTLQDVPETDQQATGYSKDDRCMEKVKRLHSLTGQNDTNIEAKRRKLLQQSDWSGVELQKPVIIRYPETARSARKFQRCISHDRLGSPLAKTSRNHITTDAIIKIASQRYRWSPGNNSIRTWHSKGHSAAPETPAVRPGSLYDISSSASKSFSSFVPESPCAGRALQIGRGKAGHETQLQSVSHTSPSLFDEPMLKAASATQYFHPQPIRRMPQSIYTRLSDSAKNGDVAFNVGRACIPRLPSDMSTYVAATESKSGESVVPETVKKSSSKISESPGEARQLVMRNRQSLFERNIALPPSGRSSPPLTEVVHDGELPKCSDSVPSSFTTPDVYRIAEASHPGKRLSALAYKRPKLAAPDLGDEDENILWKRFVLGPGPPVMVESAEHCGPDILDDKETDNRSKLGVKTSALEAPTRIASRLENASPVPDTRRHQDSTPAPVGPTPPLTVSAEGPSTASMSLSNNPETASENEAPVYFREQRDGLQTMTAFSTEAKDAPQPALTEVQHMTAKPESTFHPPSLFVGRLAASGDAGTAGVAAVPRAGGPEQSNIPAPKAPSARVMSRRRRNKRREAGRPDIRALPNIQGDPIEFTP